MTKKDSAPRKLKRIFVVNHGDGISARRSFQRSTAKESMATGVGAAGDVYRQDPVMLAERLDADVARFREAGRIPNEEDATNLAATVYSYIGSVAFRKLRPTLGDNAEQHAADIACYRGNLALSEKHFQRWVFRDRRAAPSTVLHRYAQSGVFDVYRREKRRHAIIALSLDDPAAVRRRGGEDEERGPLEVEQQIVLPPDVEAAWNSLGFDDFQRQVVDGSLTLEEAAELSGTSVSSVCRRRQEWRAMAAKVMDR